MFRRVFLQHPCRLYINPKRLNFVQQQMNCLCSSTAKLSTDSGDYLLEQAHIDEAVRLQPILSSATPDIWQRAHETFTNHGIYTMNFLRIVTGNPSVLTRSPQRIIDALELWRSCQFGEKLMHLLLTKYPELFDVNDSHKLLTHMGYLKTFGGTNKNVWKMLMNCPSLMEQPEKVIHEKINYLRQTMRIEPPEIIKSCALAKSLDEIRYRHMFQIRLGLFKPRPLKMDPDMPTKNNRLYQITDSSDKAFATKICHVTLLEYEVFKELYQRELERNLELDEELDGVEEEEDEEDDESVK